MAPAPPPPPVEAAPTEAPSADPEPDLPPVEHYSDGEDSWYDSIEFSAFVDAYASVNYNFPKPQYGVSGPSPRSANVLRAHDYNNGFALSWVGVNASYPADPVGATISLRFGPTANQIGRSCLGDDNSQCDLGQGIHNVKQAFASWKPGGSESLFTLDVGKFDTPYGAEVAESHLNMNYTRSMLYVSQPVTHTGLRGSFAVSDLFDFKVLAVNGWNNSIDNNVGKTFGAQFNFHFKNSEDADLVGVSVGYLGGPEHDDIARVTCNPGTMFNPSAKSGCAADAQAMTASSGVVDRASSNTEGWRHLVDLVVTANPIERLRLVLNADFGVDNLRNDKDLGVFDSHSYFGVLLGARVAIVDEFGVAARGEYFRDSYRFINPYTDPQDLVGGTLTLDYLPADFLTIRLDNRYDWSSKMIFDSSIRDRVGSQFTTTLGVVAHTD